MCFNNKKIISVFLIITMLFSTLNIPVLATETTDDIEIAESIEQTENTSETQEIFVEPKTDFQAENIEDSEENIIEEETDDDISLLSVAEDFAWNLSEDGTLTISGNGDMPNWSSKKAPWYSQRTEVLSAVIEEGITSIGNYAFYFCECLTSVVIPDSVTSIGNYAFDGCESLTSVAIPGSVTSIGNSAFSYCYGLTSVVIPEGVTSIGSNAFCYCSGLTSVAIPKGVTHIWDSAFYYCTSLERVDISDIAAWCNISFGNGNSNPLYYAKNLYLNGELVEELIIPEGVTSIRRYAFVYCSGLTSVVIPEGVTNIGLYAFYGCESLTSIVIPEGVTSIGVNAFCYCSGLTSVAIPKGVTRIGGSAFYYCNSLERVDISDIAAWCNISFENDYSSPLYYAKNLYLNGELVEELIIPEGITSIKNYAFYGCESLTSVVIPEGVTSIGTNAFERCSKLTSITIPDSVTSIGAYSFYGCESLTSVVIREGVTYIGDSAFRVCSGLTSITIPDSVTNMGSSAFSGCTGLTSITIPGSVTSIGNSAFSYCYGLTSVVIPEGVTSVGANAFERCSKLTSITIPDSVTNIGSHAFDGCAVNFVIYGYLDSYAEKYALQNNIAFEAIEGQGINLLIVNSENEKIEIGYEINWYDSDENVVGTGNVLRGVFEGKTYSYEIVLDEELSYIYKQPEKAEIVGSGENEEITVKLENISESTIIGTVVDENDNPIIANIKAVQTFNDKYEKEIQINTDNNGVFSAKLSSVPTTLEFAADGYYSRSRTLTEGNLSNSEYNLGNIKMTKLPTDKITLSISKQSAVKSGEESLIMPISSANNLSFKIKNKTKGTDITDFTVQYPNLIIGENTADGNDVIEISVTDNKNQMTSQAVEITLDENKIGFADIIFTENGSVEISGISGNTENIVMVFDVNGIFVKSYNVNDSFASDAMPEGTYKLVFMKKTDLLRSVANMSKLSEFGLAEGTEFAVKTVDIRSGIIAEINNVAVPVLDESKLYYTVDENTKFTANKTSVVAGNYVTLRAEYEIEGKYASAGQRVQIEIPERTVFTEASLTLDGVIHPYTVDGNTVTVNTNKSKGVIRFYVVPITAEQHNVNAYLSFEKDGEMVTQPIGTASFEGVAAKITVPEKTSSEQVTASGTILPRSKIELFDNGEKVGETTSNANGSWSLKFDLVKPYSYSRHEIYGVISNDNVGEKIKTDVAVLKFDEDYIDVSRVTMINTGDNGENVSVFNFINQNDTPAYRAWPSRYPKFSFKVEFTDSDTITPTDVYVVTTSSGGYKTYIPVTYDSNSGNWYGTHNFTSERDLPVDVSVSFNTIFDNPQTRIDANMITEIYNAIDEEDKKIEEEFENIPEPDNEAIESMNFYETMDSIDSSFMLCDNLTSEFENQHKGMVSSFGAVCEENEDGVNVFFDNYQHAVKMSDCSGLTEQQLLDEGYEKIAVTDGTFIYQRADEHSVSTVDFNRNSYITVDINEIVSLMSMDDEIMLMSGSGDALETLEVWAKRFVSFAEKLKPMTDWIEKNNGKIDELGESIKELEKEMKRLNKMLDSALDDIRIMERENIPPLEIENAHNRYTQALNRYNIMQNLRDEYTKNLQALKILKKITKGIPILTYVSIAMDAVKYTPEIRSLHSQLDSKGCPPTSAEAEMIRSEINGLTGAVVAYIVAMLGAGKAFEAAVIASATTASVSGGISIPAGLSVAVLSLISTIAIDNKFTKEYQNNYNVMVRKINSLKCEDDSDPDDGSGSGSGSGTGTGGELATIGDRVTSYGRTLTPARTADPIIDPSGYVYEAVPSNRVEGVKAECYQYDYALDDFGVPADEKSDIFWNAEDYDQENPLYTDKNGMYHWDVPVGEWLVKFSKEGYYDTDSRNDPAANENGYLPVPPPQTEVNTAIISKSAPIVESINVYNNEVQIIFSQYMLIDSINNENVKVVCGGKEIDGTITPSNAEYNSERTQQFASIFTFTPNSELKDSATVEISNVKNYNSKEIEEKFVQIKTVTVKPESISAVEKINVAYNSGALLELAILPKEAGANKNLTVTTSSPSIIGVVNATVTTDENGKANVMLNGILPGEGEITATLDGTDIKTKVNAVVGNVISDTNSCAKVTASIESGSTVEKGSKVTLSTTTEGAEIYYTLDGTCPCVTDSTSRIKYTKPIEINEDMFIIAYAVKNGFEDSATAGFIYNVTATQDKAAMPVANPKGGSVSSGSTVKLSTSTENAIIYYTTNGKIPNDKSTVYTAPIKITSATTIKAIAIKDGMIASDVMIENYTIISSGGSGGGGGSTGGSSSSVSPVIPTTPEHATIAKDFKFTDVKNTDWFYEAVKFAFEKGITSGVSETSYAPNDKVTRGQFISMLCRAYGIKEMTGDNFIDCGNTWYTGYLAAAKQLGISNGVGDNKFAPEKEITREEMVTLIYNYLKSVGKVDEEISETTFADNDSISSWAKNGVAFASSKGYVNGKGDNIFDPEGDATRAELAQIFFNMFK